jgi:hypothetical protein
VGITLSGTVKIWPLKRNPENKVCAYYDGLNVNVQNSNFHAFHHRNVLMSPCSCLNPGGSCKIFVRFCHDLAMIISFICRQLKQCMIKVYLRWRE